MKAARYSAGAVVGVIILAVCMAFMGCGKKQKIEDADARIKALKEKGIPDSLLSSATVFLFQANGAKESGDFGILRMYKDSLFFYLEKAEAWYEESMQKLKPEVDKLMASAKGNKAKLTGQQLKVADSVMTIIDSLMAKNWLLQAQAKLAVLDTMMVQLLKDEELAAQLKPKIIGTWASEQVPQDNKYKAIDKRSYTFGADGKLQLRESMKGQTEEFVKEDWEFESWGRWDIKGDTALLFIEREKCIRQSYQFYKEVNGRMQWVKEDKPTYDTTITNGSKDRFLTWEFMQTFLEKKK